MLQETKSTAPVKLIDGFMKPWVSREFAEQAAIRLREALCSVPFYARRAERARLAGDEMAYWRGLQASEATLMRPACSTAAPAPDSTPATAPTAQPALSL